MIVTVDRARWNRGKIGEDEVYLFNAYDGHLDICGFIMLDLGFSRGQLNGVMSPENFLAMHPRHEKTLSRLTVLPLNMFEEPVRTSFCDLIIEINDDPILEEWRREELLAQACEKQDLCLFFVN